MASVTITSGPTDSVLQFVLANVNVSIANALRRTIISNIPTVVMRVVPFEELSTRGGENATIMENTTRFNNEIVRGRLGCIPVHLRADESNKDIIDNYLVEVKVKNTKDEIVFVTTDDFRVKHRETNVYLSREQTSEIFPVDPITGAPIDFLRLRPQISEDIPGESIHLVCPLSVCAAAEDAMYNCASTCSYGYTEDPDAVAVALKVKQASWKEEGMTAKDVIFESKNWRLLDAQRICVQDSFTFIIETLGVYENKELVVLACMSIVDGLTALNDEIAGSSLPIEPSLTTIPNSFDVTLVNDDYTIGKVIEYFMYSKFFEGDKTLTYCGYKKMHPHDPDSLLRVAYKLETSDRVSVQVDLQACIVDAVAVFKKIARKFGRA